MRFDQPDGREPDAGDIQQQPMHFRRQPEQVSPTRDRFEWIEPIEPIIRDKQGWFVGASLVFALSPLVAWLVTSFTAAPTPVLVPESPEGPTRPAAEAPVEEDPSIEPDEPVGPTARFGATTSTSTAAASHPDTDTDETTVTTILAGTAPDQTATTDPTATRSGDPDACHPDYSRCVPIAVDVDCVGGDDDGPVFVSGPILVTGNDVYDIDANGDLIACFDGDGLTGRP